MSKYNRNNKSFHRSKKCSLSDDKVVSNFCRLKFETLNNRKSMMARDMHRVIVLLHCTSPQ